MNSTASKLTHCGSTAAVAVAMATLGLQVCHAQAVDPNAPLKGVDLGGRTVDVPGGAFQESALVTKLCQPDSPRAGVRDRSGRSYVNESDLRQVMLQGRQSAEASDRWARHVIMQTQIQKALPSRASSELRIVADPNWFANRNKPQPPAASPQQANVDYNFSVLDAKAAQLDAWGQSYSANMWMVELNALRGITQSGVPPLETLDLLRQFEWFSAENAACVNERTIGQKALAPYIQAGWPKLARESIAADATLRTERERGQSTLDATRAEFPRAAAPAILAAKPLVAAELAAAKSSDAVARAIFTFFGAGQLSTLALQDPEIQRAFEARAAALRLEEQRQVEAEQRRLAVDEERRAAGKRARIAGSMRSNSPPVLSDVQEIVLRQSLASSIAENAGAGMKGAANSASSYQLTVELHRQIFRTATARIDVSALDCKPASGMQQCSYTETFSWTRHALFDNVELPRGTTTQQRLTTFKWTAEGLVAEGKLGVRSVGSLTAGSSEASPTPGKKECVTFYNGFQQCRYN